MNRNVIISEAFERLNKMHKPAKKKKLTEATQNTFDRYSQKIQRAYDNFDASTVTKEDALNGKISMGINHDCADYVGSLAKAFDKFGIGYTIYCGVAIPKTDKVDPTDERQMMKYRNLNPNHCWLEDEYGRIFEISGYSRKVTGKEINIGKKDYEY